MNFELFKMQPKLQVLCLIDKVMYREDLSL